MRPLELDRVVVRFGREDIWSLVEVGNTFVLVGGTEERSCRLVEVRRLLGLGHALLELVLVPALGHELVLELAVAAVAERVELEPAGRVAC